MLVTFSGLCRYGLLDYESRAIQSFIITIVCLLLLFGVAIFQSWWPITCISIIRIEDYLISPPPRIIESWWAWWFPSLTTRLVIMSPSSPSYSYAIIVLGCCLLSVYISILMVFTRDNWRHHHNPTPYELGSLVYSIDTPNTFYIWCNTYITPLQTGHLRSSINLYLKRLVWCRLPLQPFFVFDLVGYYR
jgi:hypothetical protein